MRSLVFVHGYLCELENWRHQIDAFCVNLKNGHTNKQFFAGSAKFQEM